MTSHESVSKKGTSLHAGLLAAALLVLAGPASAVSIFWDDFNRSDRNWVGNGWSETENDSNDVAIRNGILRLRDYLPGNPDSAASQLGGLDTRHVTGVVLSYDWAGSSNTEWADDLWIDWKRASSDRWINVAHHHLDGRNWLTHHEVDLWGAAGHDDVQIRFWTDVSQHTEAGYIDNVHVKGKPGDRPDRGGPAVPEPAGAGLFGLGLLIARWGALRGR